MRFSDVFTVITVKNRKLESMDGKEIGGMIRFHRKKSGLSQQGFYPESL